MRGVCPGRRAVWRRVRLGRRAAAARRLAIPARAQDRATAARGGGGVTFAESKCSAHNANGPRVGSTGAVGMAMNWPEVRPGSALRSPLSDMPRALAQEAVSMSPFTLANIRRGEAVRSALLAIVHARHAAGLPLPSYEAMARAVGISAGQVSRHMAVLMDEGAFVPQRAGM